MEEVGDGRATVSVMGLCEGRRDGCDGCDGGEQLMMTQWMERNKVQWLP